MNSYISLYDISSGTILANTVGSSSGDLYLNLDGTLLINGSDGSGTAADTTSGGTIDFGGNISYMYVFGADTASTDQFVVQSWSGGNLAVSLYGTSTSSYISLHDISSGTILANTVGSSSGKLYLVMDTLDLSGSDGSGTAEDTTTGGTIDFGGSISYVYVFGTGGSTADSFDVRSWSGGNLDVLIDSSSSSSYIQFDAITDGTVGANTVGSSAGILYLQMNGALSMSGSASSGAGIDGSGTVDFSGSFSSVSLSGTGGSATDDFNVESWSGGFLRIYVAGTSSSDEVSLYFSATEITGGSINIYNDASSSTSLFVYGSPEPTVTDASTGTVTSTYDDGSVSFTGFSNRYVST